jgi:glycosyltransferase involved in cell wall biosynthesis
LLPLVSICLPVLNGEDLVARAVRSALAQDYSNIEVVIVDDASSDRTVDALREEFADRVRLFRNAERSGQARTTNAALGLADGDFIKFLHHDDYLEQQCVSRMVETLLRHPSTGMVFSRRRVEVAPEVRDGDESDGYGDLHLGFESLQELNPGRRIFEQLVANHLRENWIGEPVFVMVRRECLRRLGCLDLHVRGAVDLALWLRISSHYDVAFLDEELATYRHSPVSHIARDRFRGEHWLDRLWMLEALNADPDVMARYPELKEFRRWERRVAFRTLARALLTCKHPPGPLSRWGEYGGFRIGNLLGGSPLFGSLEQSTQGVVPVLDDTPART